MKRSKQLAQRLFTGARRRPVRTGLILAAGLLIVSAVAFSIPKTVAFSFSERTCVNELTLIPTIHRPTSDSAYDVVYERQFKVGNTTIASGSVCFVPKEAPGQGQVKIATAPWGTWLLPQLYTLDVGREPSVDVKAFERPIPTTKPISVSLDQPDILHRYELVIDEQSVGCDDEGAELLCGIDQLELAQGKKYDYELVRAFESSGEAAPIIEGTIETLRAVKVVDGTIKDKQVVYSKPRKFEFTLDKPITTAKAEIKDDEAVIDSSVKVEDKKVSIEISEDLPREKRYTLTLVDVEANDGSTLVDRHQVSFELSGGPKVTTVSVGGSRVDPNAQIVLTFDQELSEEQDVASLVSLEGGKGSASKIGPKQVAVQLGSLGRCIPFSIKVAAGVTSRHEIKSDQSWSHRSRTVCYTTTVYGTSIQGRPLVAYHFGNSGPVTLYTGAIHGNEVSSMYMMQSWINELEANPDKIGNRQIVVIPNINPDGVAMGTRNNSRNVNLSRNFPTDNWEKDINDTNGPNKGGGGSKPLSEPEAAALARFTQNLRPRLLLSYHAIGSLVVGDGHGTYSGGKAAQYAGMVGYRNATGESGTFDYSITGAYEDWTWRNVGIPSMVIELGSYTYHNFAHHRAAMWAMLD